MKNQNPSSILTIFEPGPLKMGVQYHVCSFQPHHTEYSLFWNLGNLPEVTLSFSSAAHH